MSGTTSGVTLLVGRVHTRGRGIEVPVGPRLERGCEEVGVDEHREHAQCPVVLDEPHPAHVGGEVVDVADTVDDLLAGLAPREVADTGARRRRRAGTTRRTV